MPPRFVSAAVLAPAPLFVAPANPSPAASQGSGTLTGQVSSASPIIYESPRAFVSAKFSYRVSPRTTVHLNLDNLTWEPVNNRYTACSDRTSIMRRLYPSIGCGVPGRF